ncbi:MAG: T9SS type A sorting domain-containing protein [Flavobacteriales bacterium]
MKKLYFSSTLLVAVLLSVSVHALQRVIPNESTALYKHLSEVNAEWSHINTDDYAETVSFLSEDERIKHHLNLVIGYLHENESENFNESQILNRRSLLNELSGYAEAQVFPMNLYHSERTPYFIDYRGVHCAVGYLILKSGNGELAQQISKEHNYNYINDIKTEGLTQWAEEFGFTVDELKWIQPGYPPAQQMSPLGEGTNGPVTLMTDVSTTNELVFAGTFDMLDGFPCNNIGSWNGEQLTCLGQGVVGQINDITSASNNPYLAGLFDFEGDQYPLAKYDGGGWEYHYIPERLGAEGTAILKVGAFGVEAEVVIQISDDESELWYLMTDGSWSLQCSFNGVVEKIKASSYGRIYAGAFSQVTLDGAEVAANNIIIKENYENIWFTLDGEISNHVYSIEQVGQAVYIGGTGTVVEGESEVALTRYLNGSLQTLLAGEYSIYDIKHDGESELLLAGDMIFTDIGFTFGNHLATLNLVSNSLVPLGVLDAPSRSISAYAGDFYFGGDFTLDQSTSINHLGRSTSVNSILEQANLVIKVYPNPATDVIKVELNKNSDALLELVSITGKSVLSRNLNGAQAQSSQIDVSEVARGLYYLRINQDGELSTSKIVLE